MVRSARRNRPCVRLTPWRDARFPEPVNDALGIYGAASSMPRFAWLGRIAVTDAIDPESVGAAFSARFGLDPARDDAIWMDQLRLLLCELGHHDVHRMSDDAVLGAIAERIDVGVLNVLPAERMLQIL